MQRLHDYANDKEFIRKLSHKIGIPAGYVLISLVLLGGALLYSGFGGLLLVLSAGFLYPAYMTFKALKKNNHDLLANYSKYWVIMSVGVVVHELLAWLVPGFRPFNFLVLGAILLLLKSHAATATTIYDSLIVPTLKKLESDVDSTLKTVESAVAKKEKEAAELKSKAEKKLHEATPKDKSS
eukprot:TRINITY_DN13147_c0_g1_i22.p1 TRINITY_DN13147_c0_g1~~TRINITY_DN13147_c0_g1_i22.p1  ORF type:complete len:182 (-),score=62.09 TRINITY_DN13147_c0_g1_i22:131-676(-)